MTAVNQKIRDVLTQHARLSADAATLDDRADLFQAGMTSQASVALMLALEDVFDLEFPDSMLTRSVFESIAAIESAITTLQQEPATA